VGSRMPVTKPAVPSYNKETQRVNGDPRHSREINLSEGMRNMSNSQNPEVEIETLNDEDLDSVSGGNESSSEQEPNTVVQEPNTLGS